MAIAFTAPAMAEDDIAALRQQLAEQKALNQAQQLQLERQAQALDQMSRRLDQLSAGKADAAPPVQATTPQSAAADITKARTPLQADDSITHSLG